MFASDTFDAPTLLFGLRNRVFAALALPELASGESIAAGRGFPRDDFCVKSRLFLLPFLEARTLGVP